jgi:hypothetical protein
MKNQIDSIKKKSVEELLPIMGSAYNDLSVQVAYKEGYNRAISELQDAYKRGKKRGKAEEKYKLLNAPYISKATTLFAKLPHHPKRDVVYEEKIFNFNSKQRGK